METRATEQQCVVPPPAASMSLLSLMRAAAAPPGSRITALPLRLPLPSFPPVEPTLGPIQHGQRTPTPRTPRGAQRHRELTRSLCEILAMAEEISEGLFDDIDSNDDLSVEDYQEDKRCTPESLATQKNRSQPDAQ